MDENGKPPGSSISTRVGEQYQADTPFVISKAEYVDTTPIDNEASSFSEPNTSSVWSEEEEEGFLLGLYVFGKNLGQVRSLVQSKTMAEIQRLYYGRFYNSTKHRRWSEGCRARTRRCVYGPKIFAGWRHQELLARLTGPLDSDCKSELEGTFAAFGEGKLSLHVFVCKARDLAGLNSLIEGVAIGKGKKDLTSASAGARQGAPIVKELNSLSSSEVVNLLTGGVRLSKARSLEVFWEAVWPRLLDRGWHSEKPRDYFTSANSQSLVFLIPGVKKFSRRRLLKGAHYFDSIADILQRIAAEPALIEDHHRHCYLKPPRTTVALDTSDDDDSAKSSSDITVLVQSNGEEKPAARAWLDLNALPDDDDEEESAKTASFDRESGGRRHGTRNRPPTAKALEAVAAGYLSAAHKRKWQDD